MPQTPATRDKRERESPGVSGPLCKQSKMAEGESEGQVDTNLALSKNDEKLDKMMELLESLKKGQESLQKTFDSKLEKLRNEVVKTIDDKIRSVKVDIDLQFASLERRIELFESEMSSLKADAGFVDNSVNNCDITVIATNVHVRHDRPLMDTAKALISALGTDVSHRSMITDVKRCPDRGTGKPPLLKIAFESVEQKVEVLRAKKNLSNSSEFKNVFLRSSKTHTERILGLNAKTLLPQMPNGNQFRVTGNGRTVKKDNLSGGSPTATNSDT